MLSLFIKQKRQSASCGVRITGFSPWSCSVRFPLQICGLDPRVNMYADLDIQRFFGFMIHFVFLICLLSVSAAFALQVNAAHRSTASVWVVSLLPCLCLHLSIGHSLNHALSPPPPPLSLSLPLFSPLSPSLSLCLFLSLYLSLSLTFFLLHSFSLSSLSLY